MFEQVGFTLVAGVLLGSGWRVVRSRNLVHTVLWLGMMLAATAVLFAMLQAPLLAAIQIILYTGGLLTLMLFGVMLTQRDAGFVTIPNAAHREGLAGFIASAGFGMFALAVLRTPELPDQRAAPMPVRELGALFFTHYVLAFEVLAVLLLAATLGAIVLARRADAGSAADAASLAVPARRPLPAPSEAPGRAAAKDGLPT